MTADLCTDPHHWPMMNIYRPHAVMLFDAARRPEMIAALSRELDQTYRTVAENLSSNPRARVEQVDGKDDLLVNPLELDEADSLVKLREAVNVRLPCVDLPEVLLEIAVQTDFVAKFTRVSERESRMRDLPTSLCANFDLAAP